jgi:hypothetical protein
MRKCTDGKQQGLNWTNNNILEDLDIVDDIALLSTVYFDIQEKTDQLQYFSGQVRLQINTSKTKIMDFTEINTDIKLNNNSLEKVTQFTYLGSIMSYDGDAIPEMKTRRALASNAFKQLKNVWKSKTTEQ